MERRKPGTGTIEYKRGRYWVRTSEQGRPRYGPYTTREQAAAQADALLVVTTRPTLSSGASVYQYGLIVLAKRRRQGRSNADSDESKWRLHVQPSLLGQTPIDAVRPYHVHDFLDEMTTKRATRGHSHKRNPTRRLSRSSILQVLTLVRLVLADAKRIGLLEYNPAMDIEVPKERRVDDAWTYLTLSEQHALLGAAGSPEAAIVAVAMYTGIRIGEQWSLQWPDVHDDYITIRFGGHGVPTKSGHPRDVPLLGPARFALGHWRQYGYRGKDDAKDVVFPTVRGHKRPTRHPQRRTVPKAPRDWQTWLEAAGIRRTVRYHDLRHTFATSALCGLWLGAPWATAGGRAMTMAEVAAFLGHSTTYVTARYGHLVEDLARTAAAAHDGVAPAGTTRGRKRTK